jgi:GTP-binding protein
MKISSAQYLTSSANPTQKLSLDFPHVAVMGKSNVGKSSFINYFTNNGKLARVSKQPGRTKMINYFLINNSFVVADLPGYGFAKVSEAEKERWADLIEDYLINDSNLAYALFLVDIRHEPTLNDITMYNFLIKSNIPFCIVATKADKISKMQCRMSVGKLASFFKVGIDNILPISNVEKTGLDAVIKKIEQAMSPKDKIDD